MNNTLINHWNEVVSNDEVWGLRDLAIGCKYFLKEYVPILNGRKRLILGNHNNFSTDFYRRIGFEFC